MKIRAAASNYNRAVRSLKQGAKRVAESYSKTYKNKARIYASQGQKARANIAIKHANIESMRKGIVNKLV